MDSSSPHEQKIHVADLRTGMFVCKLDKDWLDTPFIMQGFLIEDREDISIVAEYCEYVYIDVRESRKNAGPSSSLGSASFARRGTIENRESVEAEHKKMYRTFREARSVTRAMLNSLRLGAAIDTTQAKDTVDECVQSVIRHPDALLWMSRIRAEREYTAEHSLNVCILAIAFSRQLGFSEQELQDIGLCGLLHDVGKMRVPMEIVDKPGALTTKEMRMMKAHTVHGRNLLMSSTGVYRGAIDVAYSHHERIDGEGYPRKLPAAGISRYSRIISIVDAYDAMTAERCYDSAKTSTQALKVIYAERGKQFDEGLALQFIQTIGLYPAGNLVELYNGEVGIVIEANQRFRHLPRVILVLGADKKALEKEKVVDLGLIESGDLPKRYLIKQVWKDGSFGLKLRDYQRAGLILKH